MTVTRRHVTPAGGWWSGAGCMHFDGAGDKVTGVATGISGAAVHTLVAWIKAMGGINQCALGFGSLVVTKQPYLGFLSAGWCYGNYGGSVSASSMPKFGEWQRIAATYNGTHAIVYVDGSPICVPTLLTVNVDPAATVPTIGMFTGGGFDFSGDVLDARIYSRVWTPDEVLDDSYGEWVDPTGLVRHWPGEAISGGKTPELIGKTLDTVVGAIVGSSVVFASRSAV